MTKAFNNVFGKAKIYADEIEADGHTNSAKWLREDIDTAKAEYSAIKALVSDLKLEVKSLELYKKALYYAAEQAYQSEVIDTEMRDLIIGVNGNYSSKEEWIEMQVLTWLEGEHE